MPTGQSSFLSKCNLLFQMVNIQRHIYGDFYIPSFDIGFFFPESTCTGYTHEVPISILAAAKVFRTHKDVPHSEIKTIWGKDLRPIQTPADPRYAQGEKFQKYKKIHKMLHESCITFLLRLIHLCLIWNAEHTRHVCTINCVCDVRESALHEKLVGFFFPQLIKTRWYSDCLHRVVFKESLLFFFSFFIALSSETELRKMLSSQVAFCPELS